MRRISSKRAEPGMVLGRAVYDNGGYLLLAAGAKLYEETLNTLSIYGVGEIMIKDPRVSDVAVQPLIPPELEAAVTQALRQMITESIGSSTIEDELLREVETSVYSMVRESFPQVVGEVNVTGCQSLEDYHYAQSAKAASLAMLIGKICDYDVFELTKLGLSTLMMNLGFVLVPPSAMDNPDSLMEKIRQDIPRHPERGAEILQAHTHLGKGVMDAVEQHHERWDGSGYPARLKGEEICQFARIIAIADTYYELVSLRPDRPAYMPHEAAEFIIAYSGALFDPELVRIFSRLVPLYPTGTTVRLNSGEVGIISNANLGHIARPIVRVCAMGRKLRKPYEINLSQARYQDRLVVEVDPYLPPPEE